MSRTGEIWSAFMERAADSQASSTGHEAGPPESTGRQGVGSNRAKPCLIELRVEKPSHLFDSLDPFPIPSRDLSQAAENFIFDWARDFPKTAPIRILVHVPEREFADTNAADLQAAFANHFDSRARTVTRDLKEMFRVGRVSLAIGLGVLVACVLGGQAAQALLGEGSLARVPAEGLIILGWVANWRPLEIFLYDWWPLTQRRRLYRRLAAACIDVVQIHST